MQEFSKFDQKSADTLCPERVLREQPGIRANMSETRASSVHTFVEYLGPIFGCHRSCSRYLISTLSSILVFVSFSSMVGSLGLPVPLLSAVGKVGVKCSLFLLTFGINLAMQAKFSK